MALIVTVRRRRRPRAVHRTIFFFGRYDDDNGRCLPFCRQMLGVIERMRRHVVQKLRGTGLRRYINKGIITGVLTAVLYTGHI